MPPSTFGPITSRLLCRLPCGLRCITMVAAIGMASACIGVPSSRPYVDWGPNDHVAVGTALYDSTEPSVVIEGAFVFGAVPMGDFDIAAALQVDFSRGLNSSGTLGGGGTLGIRYRFRLIESLEVVPEISGGLVSLRSPNGVRQQAMLLLTDVSLRYEIVESAWVYLRPGVGGGASVFGTSIGAPFPAIRFSYGAQWALKPCFRLFVEGSVGVEVGEPNLALGVLTVF